MEDRSYSRCKACDRPFYPRWDRSRKEFETLCHVCLPKAFLWDKSDDSDFLEGFLMDKITHEDEDYG